MQRNFNTAWNDLHIMLLCFAEMSLSVCAFRIFISLLQSKCKLMINQGSLHSIQPNTWFHLLLISVFHLLILLINIVLSDTTLNSLVCFFFLIYGVILKRNIYWKLPKANASLHLWYVSGRLWIDLFLFFVVFFSLVVIFDMFSYLF